MQTIGTFFETRQFDSYQDAATYLSTIYHDKNRPKAEVTCQFKECTIKYIVDHDYLSRLTKESLDMINMLSQFKFPGIENQGMVGVDRNNEYVYHTLLTANVKSQNEREKVSEQMKIFTSALKSLDLPVSAQHTRLINTNPSEIKKNNEINYEKQGWKTLPQEIIEQLNQNQFLSYLNLANNQLTHLNGLIHLRFLKKINLSNNQFREVPLEIQQAGFLVEIDLRGNPLTEIPSWLKNQNFGKVKILHDPIVNHSTQLSDPIPTIAKQEVAVEYSGLVINRNPDGTVSLNFNQPFKN